MTYPRVKSLVLLIAQLEIPGFPSCENSVGALIIIRNLLRNQVVGRKVLLGASTTDS